MSKAMQALLAVLVLSFIGISVLAGFALMKKQSLEQQNQYLQNQVSDQETRATKTQTKLKQLEQDLKKQLEEFQQAQKQKEDLQKNFDDIKTKSDDLSNQIGQLSKDRDQWKERLETIRKERDDLMEKLKHPKVKIVYKDRPESGGSLTASSSISSFSNSPAPALTSADGDQYWASVLKQKAAMQLDMQKVQSELDQSQLQIVDLKRQNAELQLDLKNASDNKQETDRKIQELKNEYDRKLRYSEELANSISVDVARARGDQRNSGERAERLKQENLDLQSQVKQLTSTKLSLEKTIAQINQDKVMAEKKLAQTEGLIQGRINEIWQIKENLDKKISELPQKASEVELPPIIVNAGNTSGAPGSSASNPASAAANTPVPTGNAAFSGGAKSQGSIISINEPNNFAIVDLGEADGSQVGRKLTVFRGNSSIGNLEVIQVRKDISAADIKGNTMKLKVGDIVRY